MRPLFTGAAVAVILALLVLVIPAQAQDHNDNRTLCEHVGVKGSIEACTAIIQSGTESTENLTFAFFDRGINYHGRAEYDRAIQDYDRAIRLNPAFAEVFEHRGLAFFMKNDLDRATHDFDEVVRLKPDRYQAFYYRADVDVAKGDYDRAIKDYSDVIRLNPRHAGAFERRAWNRFYLKQFELAADDFQRAFELWPTSFFRTYAALGGYISRARTGDLGTQDLEKQAAQLKLEEWPGPIIKFYLGRVSREAVMLSAKDSVPVVERGNRCRASFYLGEYALIRHDDPAAMQLFQQVVDSEFNRIEEYRAAKAELGQRPVSAK